MSTGPKCTGCGLCMEKCPSKNAYDQFNFGVAPTRAINIPFPQAIPKKAKIDANFCRQFVKGKCGVCAKVCPTGAINYEMQDEIVTEDVGAIVVASGYGLMDIDKLPEYGGGRYPMSSRESQYERLLNASGPTEGHILRPSDKTEPKTVVFVSCAGSPGQVGGVYRTVPTSAACTSPSRRFSLRTIFPTPSPLSSTWTSGPPGKGYDEFTRRAQEDYGAKYRTGKGYHAYIPKGREDGSGGERTHSSAPRWRLRPTSSSSPMQSLLHRELRGSLRSSTFHMIRSAFM